MVSRLLRWLEDLGKSISTRGEVILIGSGGLLWHADHRGVDTELPEASMDVDPITDSDEITIPSSEVILNVSTDGM